MTTKKDDSTGLPIVFYFPSVSLTLKCPSCGKESVIVVAKEQINCRAKATCGKCKQTFIIEPNVRKNFRKDVDIACRLSLQPIEGTKPKGTLKAQLINISESGLGLVVQWRVVNQLSLEVGSVVHLCFSIPKGSTQAEINTKGEIKSIRSPDDSKEMVIGLELLDRDGSALKKLAFFLWN